MISANLLEEYRLYPAAIIFGPVIVDLKTNFGYRPFKSITDDILQEVLAERRSIENNALKFPRRWCRYSAHSSLQVSGDGREVELQGALMRIDGPVAAQV